MLFIFLILVSYMTIGIILSMYWADQSIDDAGEDWDALAFLLRCCFKWPVMIFESKRR